MIIIINFVKKNLVIKFAIIKHQIKNTNGACKLQGSSTRLINKAHLQDFKIHLSFFLHGFSETYTFSTPIDV